MRRTKTGPGGPPARRGQEAQAHAHTHVTRARRAPTRNERCQRPHETAPVHRTSAPSKCRRYRNWTRERPGPHTQTTAAHTAQDRPRRDPPGTTPLWGPKRVPRGADVAPLPRQGPEAGTMSPVLRRPPRAPRSRPVNPGVKAPGLGKCTGASEEPTGAPRATRPDEVRPTRQQHEARQRGTPPATTKSHGQERSNNGQRVPQTRTACTTHNQPRRGTRCQATPNPHTTNPSQEWRGRGGARTHAHTPATPQPGMAGRSPEPSPSTHTHTAQRRQDWRGTGGARTPKHTPHQPNQEWWAESQNPNRQTHTTNPSQDRPGRGGARTSTPTRQHPSQESRSAAKT